MVNQSLNIIGIQSELLTALLNNPQMNNWAKVNAVAEKWVKKLDCKAAHFLLISVVGVSD